MERIELAENCELQNTVASKTPSPFLQRDFQEALVSGPIQRF